MLKVVLKENKAFLIPYLVFVLSSSVGLLYLDKYNLQLWLNQFHTSYFDHFFSFFTHLGEAYVLIAILLIAFCLSYKTALQYIFSYALGGILILLGKHFLFAGINRPFYYFGSLEEYHFVDGVTMNVYHSFPSGHTQAGFTAFFFLCLLLNKPSLKLLSFLFALLVAYSRVYLSQHFVSDILVGSLIAVASCLIIKVIFDHWKWNPRGNLISVFKVAIARWRK